MHGVDGDPDAHIASIDHGSDVERRHLEWYKSVGHLLKERPLSERYARFVAWTKRHHDA